MSNVLSNPADRLDEFVSLRLPAGAGRLLTDDAHRMGLSRSELLRRAAMDYIRRANAKSKKAQP